MAKDSSLEAKDILILCLLGFLALSPVGTYIIMDYAGLPMSLPELFFLLLFPFLPKEIKTRFLFNKSAFFKLFLLLCLLLIIGIVVGNYPTVNLISTFRIYFDCIFFFSLSSKREGVELPQLAIICVGSLLGWLVMCFVNLKTFFYVDTEGGFVSLGNTLAIPIGLFSASLSKKNRLFILALILSISVCLLSAVRRPILILVASMLMLTFTRSLTLNNKRTLVLVVIIIAIAIPLVGSFLSDNYAILYRRTFEKTTEFIKRESNPDDDFRKENISSFSLADNILPRGLVTRDTVNDPDGGLYIDYPFMEYFYTFGLFFFGVLGYLVKLFLCCRRYYLQTRDSSSKLQIMMFFIFIILSFVEGTFLSSTYIVPLTGYCLGQLYYFCKTSSDALT